MQTQTEVWTLSDALHWATEQFTQKGIESPNLNAERLLGKVLRLNRVALYLHMDRRLTPEESHAFQSLVERRLSHEPLQYILGEVEFYGFPIRVTPQVLIPRPETEIVVDHTLRLCRQFSAAMNMVDIGTGSGAIAIALARHLPGAHIVALDISMEALRVAAENIRLNQVEDRVSLVQADILRQETAAMLACAFQIVVSNPPYIAPEEKSWLAPEIYNHEPHRALFAGDPLRFYRAIAAFAGGRLVPGGFVVCELPPHRAQTIQRLFEQSGFGPVTIHPDLTGKPRVLIARTKTQKEVHSRD